MNQNIAVPMARSSRPPEPFKPSTYQGETIMGWAGQIDIRNAMDGDGNPAGGNVNGNGFNIWWHDGPLGRTEDGEYGELYPNGAFIEDVLLGLIKRMEFYQASKFACEENTVALGHLQAAAVKLAQRREDREARGVLGLHKE